MILYNSGVNERLRPLSQWLASHWPGRIVLGVASGVLRLELFDRAMAISAQLFTSVVPVLIMLSVWLGEQTTKRLADAIDMPPVAQEVLWGGLDGSGGAAFGFLGAAIVLVSATSLSRALTRAMATIWELPRPKPRLSSAWRWLAVILVLTSTGVTARFLTQFTEPLPPQHGWSVVLTFCLDLLLSASVPWLLLPGQVSVRTLIPGAITFALAMVAVRSAIVAYLPGALEHSADRYGPIGIAFAYLTTLYVLAFTFLAAHILGHAVAQDTGGLGQFIRRESPAAGP